MSELNNVFTANETEKTDNLVFLTDADGTPVTFEFLGQIKYKEENYVVLLPTENEVEEVVTILKLESTADQIEHYTNVKDVETLNAVFEIFKDKFKDAFDFV